MGIDRNREWTSFYHKELNVSIKVPTSWEIGNNEDFQLILIAPVDDGYRANIGLNIYEFTGGDRAQFEKAILTSKENLETEYRNYKMLQEDQIWIDGLPAYHQRYEWTTEQDAHFVQTLTLIFVPDRLYEMNGTSKAGLGEKYLDLLEEIITSLRIVVKE